MKPFIYFDTNFFYRIINGNIKKENLERFIDFSKKNSIKLFYTPITLTELASHINEEEKENFTYYQQIIYKIKEICSDNVLENPDHILATILGVPPPKREDGRSISYLNKIKNSICEAKDYNHLIKGQVVFWDGKLSLVKYHEDSVNKFRDNYEADWISHMHNYVVRKINPAYPEKLKLGKHPAVSDPTLRKNIIKFLNGSECKKAFAEACYCKAMDIPKELLIGSQINSEVGKIIKRLSAYYTAYKTIMKKIVTDGYNVEKNKNDFNDLHYLIYLGLENNPILISYDNKLKEKIKGASQEKQFNTMEDILEKDL